MSNPIAAAMNFFSPSNPNPADKAAVESTKGLSDPNPTLDANGKPVGSEQTPVNPLDAYKKMFENANRASENTAPSFKLDPKVLSEVSASMDFTKGVDQALVEQALKGDAASLMKMMQEVSRNAYRASLEHTSALTDTHLSQRGDYDQKNMQATVRSSLTDQALSTAQNYDHPLVKQELNRVASQLAKSNPDMPPAEIAKTAQKYIQDMAAALTSKPEATKQQKDENFDWSKYLKN